MELSKIAGNATFHTNSCNYCWSYLDNLADEPHTHVSSIKCIRYLSGGMTHEIFLLYSVSLLFDLYYVFESIIINIECNENHEIFFP